MHTPAADYLARILTPEVLLPSQMAGQRSMSPEHRLMNSILEDALACLRLASIMRGKTGQMARHAEMRGALDMAWVESRDMEWPFAFERICEELGYSISAIRKFARAVNAGALKYARVNRVSGTRTRMGGRGEE